MTSAPQHVETEIELTDEEYALATDRARMLGFDLETFFRVRALTSQNLPEPTGFLAIVARLQNFAADYRAHMQAIAERQPGLNRQSQGLEASFAQLLQDWDKLYGPR